VLLLSESYVSTLKKLSASVSEFYVNTLNTLSTLGELVFCEYRGETKCYWFLSLV